jgi:hypothetical protein
LIKIKSQSGHNLMFLYLLSLQALVVVFKQMVRAFSCLEFSLFMFDQSNSVKVHFGNGQKR